jgi:hypothetical protein
MAGLAFLIDEIDERAQRGRHESPGNTATTPAAGIVWLACLAASGITGAFFFDREIAPW